MTSAGSYSSGVVVPGNQSYRPFAPAPVPSSGFGGWGTDASGAARVTLPARRDPLILLLGTLIVLSAGALVGLVIAGFTARPAATAYANEDYSVPAPQLSPPPIPVPQSADEAERWRTANAVYAHALPAPVRCPVAPVELDGASRETLQGHFDGLTGCLARTWEPALTAAGFTVVRPSVTVYDDEVSTRCGRMGINAFYCSADQQLYVSTRLARQTGLRGRWAADVVMAHEYGHLVQGRTGLFAAGVLAARDAATDDERLAYARRLETQADCFSATSLRSVSTSIGIRQDDLTDILRAYAAGGDDRRRDRPEAAGNHGRADTRVYWGTVGLSTSDLGRCNTFTAPAGSVR